MTFDLESRKKAWDQINDSSHTYVHITVPTQAQQSWKSNTWRERVAIRGCV